ncbi:HTH-type transcriptional regulator PgrR [invertebrate metagenome]|uniref:HTH-type transcriptional regulator PgrR n=1 Tax=invertebrate metagenome TaxID=1711999 RepID=A0A2H9T7L9_9ZZZZ
MDIEIFQMLNEVAISHSFTAASKKLDIPKSTISKKIKNFEKKFGVSVFVRNTRYVKVTRLGSAIIKRSNKILHEHNELLTFINGCKEKPEGTVKVIAPSEFNVYILSYFISEFCQRYPDINIECSTHIYDNHAVADLDFDVLFSLNGVRVHEDLICRNLPHFNRKLVVSPDYLALRAFNGRAPDLGLETLIMNNTDPWVLRQADHQLTIKPKQQKIQSDSMRFSLNLCLNGAGIAALPAMFVDKYLDEGKLVEVLPDWSMPEEKMQIIYPSRSIAHLCARVFIQEFMNYDYRV